MNDDNSRDLHLLRVAQDEVYQRGLRVKPIPTVRFECDAPEGLSALAFPGAVTVYFAADGDDLLDRIRKTYAEQNGKNPELQDEVFAQAEGLEPISLDEAVALMKRQPVFADIRYAGNTLAPHMFVPPGKRLGAITFPYNGGELASPGFELAEHYVDGSDQALDAIAIAWVPPLTAVELAALKAVPKEQRELNVAFSDDCEWTTVAYAVTATLLVAAVTVQAVTVTTIGLAVGKAEAPMTEDDVKELGPHPSARDLLERRREIMRAARKQ